MTSAKNDHSSGPYRVWGKFALIVEFFTEKCQGEGVIPAYSPLYKYGRPLFFCVLWSISRGQDFRLHQLHGLSAALDLAVPGLDAEHFRVAVLALKSLAKLVCQRLPSAYCFCCIVSPQQASSPSPPLVTIISVLHLAHM
jgi:hypothetical protein